MVAVLVVLNFCQYCAEAQMLPVPGSPLDDFFAKMDVVFTVCFLIELLLNLFVNWFW